MTVNEYFKRNKTKGIDKIFPTAKANTDGVDVVDKTTHLWT